MTDRPARNAICLCSDANMLVPAFFIASTAASDRMRLRSDYDVIVVTGKSDTTDDHRRWLADRGIGHCDDMDLSVLQDIHIAHGRLTKATMYKLLLAGHFAGRYDKILYLDADVVIHDEVGAIFALDTGAFPLAAVPSGRLWGGWNSDEVQTRDAHCRALGMTEPYHYINSGVLLIDTAKWNREDLGARTLQFVRENPELCKLPDEDALNAILDGRQAEISPLWNMRGSAWGHREIRDVMRPVIIHYDGPKKPWKLFGRDRRLLEFHAAYRDYARFVATTPWPSWLATQWTWRDLYDNALYEFRHQSRRIRGKPTPAYPGPQPEYTRAYRQWCTQADFADVDQGIVSRAGERLFLSPNERSA